MKLLESIKLAKPVRFEETIVISEGKQAFKKLPVYEIMYDEGENHIYLVCRELKVKVSHDQ